MDQRVDKILELVRKSVLRLFPELAGRYHLVAKARVVSTSGGLHLQLLKADGNVDPDAPQVVCDAAPVRLVAGDQVEVGFRYGDPSEPYVIPKSYAALGTYTGGAIEILGYGTVTDYAMASHLAGIEPGSQVVAVPVGGKRFAVIAQI